MIVFGNFDFGKPILPGISPIRHLRFDADDIEICYVYSVEQALRCIEERKHQMACDPAGPIGQVKGCSWSTFEQVPEARTITGQEAKVVATFAFYSLQALM